ncbi:tyrosine--tRNA ligase [Occultella glacieicola]|uniref:Tyrosine--tRNA ligase n=1 Tax=Occultella glacieicola TaxID=2518684 RepID=A0ABY2E180_9MICO|nr:tyrosine--tRNA ligase [Occultella glacieicola]TDE91675.1 tyrosine--tRNA ligase [Occultella glacieicola]
MNDSQDVLTHLGRTTDQIFGRTDLIDRLASGRPMRIKFGVDCTAPDLHLGHAVNLWMMRYLQDLGHVVVFLLGDTTTRIGDPTGRDRTRPVLTPEEIETNARAFLRQVSVVLRDDPAVLEVRRNSEWFDAMAVTDLMGELSLVTHAQLIARDMFQARVRDGQEIGVHELIYPVLQGYDSVALASDLTIVGSDQLFNETVGRQLQAKHGQRPQTVITSTITPGLDGGAKQSKSLNNYVALAHSPTQKFGRLMTLRDDLIDTWARVYTDLPDAVVAGLERRARQGGANSRDAKLDLAEAIVARYHGAAAADRARAEFTRVFSGNGLPDDVPHLIASPTSVLLEIVLTARPELSRNAARRLIADGAVSLDGRPLREADARPELSTGSILRVGRRNWFEVVVGSL